MTLPTGPRVVFLFTDIEGSTRLERAVGSTAWASVVARHDALLRAAIETHGGIVVKTEGDAFFAAFDDPVAAIGAAAAGQRAIAAEPWPAGVDVAVRMGLHVGEGRLREGSATDYVGIDVNYTARIAAAGNGRQTVVSDALMRDLAGAGADAGLTIVDEGLRAVKDFDEPLRLHRLVVSDIPGDERRLRTIDPPSNLPGDVTPLVGREDEIRTVAEALLASRIVTLTGPGGSGKTRLALGVARAVADRFPHGTWFVDLAALREPALVESTIAAAIGVRETTDDPIGEALRTRLRSQTTLLVLDNLEQLLPDAADVVASLARAAPDLRVLATSRELLRIAGERGHPVPPLDVSSGVELFAERARTHRPSLVVGDEAMAAIRAICERLGGLPLAIELAAARVRTLSPSQILDRLGRSLDLAAGTRDLPERQRTLRAAIAWSHDLLDDAERRLFRRLGVFAGGCTIEEAEAVVDALGDVGVDVADGLESLADKSLVRVDAIDAAGTADDGETRFGLHPLIREFALERLDECGERDAVEARHAAVMTEVAERLGAGILTAAGEASMRHLDHEEHNLRAALDRALAGDDPDPGLRLLGATWRWYQQRGRIREARAVLADLLDRPTNDPRIRIAGLAAEGGLASWMEDIPAARGAYEERLALAESLGDADLIADGHYDLGFVHMVDQDADGLRHHEQLALEGYVAAGRSADAVRARQAFVLALMLVGDYATARAQHQATLAQFRAQDSHTETADAQTLHSAILFRLGLPQDAWREMAESLRFFAAGALASGIARAMVMAAILDLLHGDPERGARIAGVTYELSRAHNVMLAPVTVLHMPEPRTLALERLGSDRAQTLLATGAATPLETVIDEVLTVDPSTFTPAVPMGVG
ncbi:MAG TPA: adenylate/guanylate cyclase domain-containing protein, partial [Candidatus Limnocylindrales bacterium]|nr:adenylate/guanylate cyclase domain-containing protein [Candidatus Limnocylindrales bacterium]